MATLLMGVDLRGHYRVISSFRYATKLIAGGEGGAVVSNNSNSPFLPRLA